MFYLSLIVLAPEVQVFEQDKIVPDSQLVFHDPTLTPPPVVMKSLKYLSYVGKFAGLVTALDGIPFVDPSIGVIVFAAASLLKDTANRIGDLLDDGKPNKSFRG